MPDGISCRKGRETDADVIVAYQLAMARETEDLELDPEVLSRGVRAVFERGGPDHYWIAESGGDPVGSLLITPEWSDWRNGWVHWIQSVYVVPPMRGKKVFRALYDAVRADVVSRTDVRGLRLYVDHRNRHAQKVYRAIGMSDEHYAMFEWMKD